MNTHLNNTLVTKHITNNLLIIESKSQYLKTLLKFLEAHKQINKTNVALLDKEITEDKIYELRAYTEGKLSHLSFGHSINGWTDQNGVIITNSKPVRKTKTQKESDLKSTWTEDQQQYLNDMETRINQKIDDNQTETNKKFELMNKKIDDNHTEIKKDINLLTTAIKDLTVSLTKHINDHK